MSGEIVPAKRPSTSIEGARTFKIAAIKRRREIDLLIRQRQAAADRSLKNVDALIAAGSVKEAKVEYKLYSAYAASIRKLRAQVQLTEQLALSVDMAGEQMKHAKLQHEAARAYANINASMPAHRVVGVTQNLQYQQAQAAQRTAMIDDANEDLLEAMMADMEVDEDEDGDAGASGEGFDAYLQLKVDQSGMGMPTTAGDALPPAPMTDQEKMEDGWRRKLLEIEAAEKSARAAKTPETGT
jgi:hypothetical protein